MSGATSTRSGHGLERGVLALADKPGAFRYLTRGLTSSIYALDLPSEGNEGLKVKLAGYGASSSCIVVKCVDLEDEARPHSVLKEIRLLQSLWSSDDEGGEGRRFIAPFLDTSEDIPDDFTTIQCVFLPYYPSTLTEWLVHDAQQQGNSESSVDARNRCSFVARVAYQLFSALCFLHSQGIAHRDVKPSNLLLTHPASSCLQQSEKVEVRLCDFGTAHSGVDEQGASSRPKTCSTSTHPYTPPELLFSPQDGYDGTKVDVWEAGCVVAECFGRLKETSDPVVDRSRTERIGERGGGGGGNMWPSAALDFSAPSGSNGSGSGSKRASPDDGLLGPPLRAAPGTSASAGASSGRMMLGSAFDHGEGENEDEDDFWKKREADLFKQDGSDGPKRTTGGGLFASYLPKPAVGSNGTSASPGLGRPLSLDDDDEDESFEALPADASSATAQRSFIRLPLFGAAQGDLGLAADIFTLLGLPEPDQAHLWPEAVRFRPPLDRMPFVRKPVASKAELEAKLRERLVDLYGQEAEDEAAKAISDVLLGCLRLSAGERWDARRAADRLAAVAVSQANEGR